MYVEIPMMNIKKGNTRSVTTLKGRSITGKELTIEIPRHPASAYKLSELQKHFSK
jgi:hypothetical protein